ncbi:MAG: NAD-dependent DNA ligase LigA [Prevotella sp.]|nr:NAD-dependent DNA ligase LigA [Prevotella sp.]
MENEKRQRMLQLIEELNRASDAYYNGMTELMTDYEWDARFDELKQLEDETGEKLPDSPTHRVSEDNITGQKEAHEFAALSLAKTKQVGELAKWAEGRPIWISWKLDGLTLVVTYDNGRLAKVVTRGNGHVGTNITHLARAINGIPPTIPSTGHTVIRGEAVISYDDFNRFLIESGEDYANPRNLASGSLTLKDVDEVKRRNIQWIPFTLVNKDADDIISWGKRMDWLQSQGLNTVAHELIADPTAQHVEEVIGHWNPEQCPYPVDGLVVAYDDTAYAQTGSVTGHHATRAGLAFKWQDESARTELIQVEWSCAASTISPVAIFRPVELEGTTVKRASLCNISECERLGIGGEGTRLQVIKANKIIPKVIHVDETVGTFSIPEECPVCRHATRIEISGASGTRTLHCTNAYCPAKQLKRFARFVSKDGMDIDGISEQTLSKFINLGWISEFADIFDLQRHIHEIATMDGFGQKSASNMMRSIEKARDVEAQKLLYALTIPMCGHDVCKRLLTAYSLKELIDAAVNATETDFFSHIQGIGPEKSASFVRWFNSEENARQVEHLMEKINVREASLQPAGQACAGMTFVITGDVHRYKNRNELKAYIESQGGRVAGSVSGSTSFLINNDVTSASGKNQKAQQLGIPIISEDDFIGRFASETSAQSRPTEGSLF